MSRPTVLGPWFVVQQLHHGDNKTEFCDPGLGCQTYMTYYTAIEDGTTTFTTDKTRALLFMSLGSAGRVAVAETAEVRVLTTEAEAIEFGRN